MWRAAHHAHSKFTTDNFFEAKVVSSELSKDGHRPSWSTRLIFFENTIFQTQSNSRQTRNEDKKETPAYHYQQSIYSTTISNISLQISQNLSNNHPITERGRGHVTDQQYDNNNRWVEVCVWVTWKRNLVRLVVIILIATITDNIRYTLPIDVVASLLRKG